MKKLWLSTLLLSVAAGMLLATNASVAADTTNPATVDTADNNQVDATTDASVSFKGGTLSLSNVPDVVAFSTADQPFNVQDIWTNGAKADQDMSATVENFLGAADANWTLTVQQGKWTAGTTGTAAGATALDASAHLLVDNQDLKTAVTFGTGSSGRTVLQKTLTLAIDKRTLLSQGTYTNTLTWTLTNSVAATQQ